MIEALLRDLISKYLDTRHLNIGAILTADSIMPAGLWEITRDNTEVVRYNHVFSSAFCTWTAFLQDTEHCYELRLSNNLAAIKKYNRTLTEHERL